jgi:hypothetical protein
MGEIPKGLILKDMGGRCLVFSKFLIIVGWVQSGIRSP